MRSISRTNIPALDLLERIGSTHNCVFAGYSGRDIDYFPFLRRRLKRKPFWIDLNDSHDPDRFRNPATERNSSSIDALKVFCRPSSFFEQQASLNGIPADRGGVQAPGDMGRVLDLLENKLRRSVPLSERQKDFLLSRCLRAIGDNVAALAVSTKVLVALPGDDAEERATTYVHHANLLDCVSDYDASLTYSGLALRETEVPGEHKPRRGNGVVRLLALRALAIGQSAMAAKMTMGPSISYGPPEVQYAPTFCAWIGAMVRYVISVIAQSMLLRRLRREIGLTSKLDQLKLASNANHANGGEELLVMWKDVISQKLVLFAFLLGLTERVKISSFRIVRRLLWRLLSEIDIESRYVGNYFDIANVAKYQARLEGTPALRDADEIFDLVQDPLNRALVYRNIGERLLGSGNEDDLRKAEGYFRKAKELAAACGSSATVLKAMAGLYACGDTRAFAREELLAIRKNISGRGYVEYVERLLLIAEPNET